MLINVKLVLESLFIKNYPSMNFQLECNQFSQSYDSILTKFNRKFKSRPAVISNKVTPPRILETHEHSCLYSLRSKSGLVY